MQRDRHPASGDLCRESTPLGERFGFHSVRTYARIARKLHEVETVGIEQHDVGGLAGRK